jgi:hypothetical protein
MLTLGIRQEDVMDEVSVVVEALAAGAAAGVKDAASSAVKDAYVTLRTLAARRLRGRPHGNQVLAEHADDPETWAAPLTEELAAVETPADPELLAAARAVLMLTDKADQKPTKYHVEIENSQGVYVGDGGTQTNYFGNPPGRRGRRSGHRRLGMARRADTKGKPLK